MARPKEHNIQRKLWNTPISKNGQFKNGLLAAMNWNTMNYALNNDYIKNNEAYVSFHKSQQCRNLLGCKQYLSRLKDMETPQILETLYGIKVTVCKCCGGHLGKPQQRIPLRI